MMKRLCSLLLLCALLPGAALAGGVYSFPYAGVRLEADDGWTVLTPQTLEDADPFLAGLGADKALMRERYDTTGTVLEAFLPGGAQVRLTAVQTEDTLSWASTAQMSETDKQALFDAYDQPPYENTRWLPDRPGYLAADWTLQAGGMPVYFSGLITVERGTLYTLIASGASITAQGLMEANLTVLSRLSFLGMNTETTQTDAAPHAPAPVPDDGKTTPLSLEGFDGVTYEDETPITLKTLPGAELVLRTATDALRGRAGEDGLHTFRVSTRRETVYAYAITAQAEGRTQSRMEVAVDRQLTPEMKEANYKKSAQALEAYGYSNLVGAPDAYAGRPVTFRGRVGDSTDMAGFPCVLVFTENPGRNVWRSPMWVMLTQAVQLSQDDICTVYGDLRGDALGYTDADGKAQSAPVVIGHIVSK